MGPSPRGPVCQVANGSFPSARTAAGLHLGQIGRRHTLWFGLSYAFVTCFAVASQDLRYCSHGVLLRHRFGTLLRCCPSNPKGAPNNYSSACQCVVVFVKRHLSQLFLVCVLVALSFSGPVWPHCCTIIKVTLEWQVKGKQPHFLTLISPRNSQQYVVTTERLAGVGRGCRLLFIVEPLRQGCWEEAPATLGISFMVPFFPLWELTLICGRAGGWGDRARILAPIWGTEQINFSDSILHVVCPNI